MAGNVRAPVFNRQPNFDAAAQSLNAVATELQRCSNMPAIQGGNEILQELRQMNTRMQGIETTMQGMETRMQGMETSIGELRTEMENGFARQQAL